MASVDAASLSSSSSDFHESQCGGALLRALSGAHAALAQVQRLASKVPPPYSSRPPRAEAARYGEVATLDFAYFRSPDAAEARIESSAAADREVNCTVTSAALSAADEELRAVHLEQLAEFYRLFASVRRVGAQLGRAAEALIKGRFLGATLEGAFQDPDGRQLLCECLYVYGCLLLLLDHHLEGPVRERLLVAFYRYSGQDLSEEFDDAGSIDDICKLMRSTGYSSGSSGGGSWKRPPNYPESLFSRLPLPERFISLAVAKLRSDDLYFRVARCYPDPEHRSTALSEQASMLFVCLFFSPQILRDDQVLMKEIVDRFFSDNWVVSSYMGSLANLAEWWEPYKAAKSALSHSLRQPNVREVSMRYGERAETMAEETDKLLREGALSEETLLDHVVKVLNMVRECNVALRWLLLHTAQLSPGSEQIKKCRQLRDQVLSDCRLPLATFSGFGSLRRRQQQQLQQEALSSPPHLALLFRLLLNTAEFELRLRAMYRGALKGREKAWEKAKVECRERMRELADFYSGEQTLFGKALAKNKKLQAWFLEREAQVASLDSAEPQSAGRTAVTVVEALDRALEFDALESNVQVKQILADAKEGLHRLIRLAGVKEEVLITLQVIGDLSYAWGDTMDSAFTDLMRNGVRKDPKLVGRLRATFLKLSFALEGPVFRIGQSGAPSALASVSRFYSSQMVDYVTRVLQVIPETVFGLLGKIARLRTPGTEGGMEPLPPRMERERMKELAQLDKRMELAKLTHSVSVFAEGMLALKSTLVGVIQLDARQLLQDGIRRELSRQIRAATNKELSFGSSGFSSSPQLSSRLGSLAARLEGLRGSLEYAQDHIGINGLKIWHEEFSAVVDGAEESDGGSFLGLLLDEILRVTSPKTTVFVPSVQSWFDCLHSHLENFSEVAGALELAAALEAAVGPRGLAALDRMVGFRVAATLTDLSDLVDKTLKREKSWAEALDNLGNSLNPTDNVIAQPTKFYASFTGKSPKLLSSVVETIVSVGQLQLLRKQFAHRLYLAANVQAKGLCSSLNAMNQTMMLSLKKDLQHDSGKKTVDRRYVDKDGSSQILCKLSSYLQRSGMSEPGQQVYVMVSPPPKFPELLFLALITALPKANYSSKAGGLIGKKHQDPFDGYVFTLGYSCLLRQYPNFVCDTVISYVAQYVRSHSEAASLASKPSKSSSSHCSSPLMQEVRTATLFLESLTCEREEASAALEAHLPASIRTDFLAEGRTGN